ncbi:MAG: hypothetical protein ABEJ65_02360, partial [bacterium]
MNLVRNLFFVSLLVLIIALVGVTDPVISVDQATLDKCVDSFSKKCYGNNWKEAKKIADHLEEEYQAENSFKVVKHWIDKGKAGAMYKAAKLCEGSMAYTPPQCSDDRAKRDKIVSKYYTKAANNGSVPAMLELGMMADKAGNASEAKKWFTKAKNSATKKENKKLAKNFLHFYKTGVPKRTRYEDAYKGTSINPEEKIAKREWKKGNKKYIAFIYKNQDNPDYQIKQYYHKIEKEMKKRRIKKAKKAVKNPSPENLDILLKACAGEIDFPVDMVKGDNSIVKRACKARKKTAVAHYKQNVTCENAVSMMTKNKYVPQDEASTPYDQVYIEAGKKLADCGKWDTIMKKLVHWGKPGIKGMGTGLLKILDNNGRPVMEKVKAHLEKNSDDPSGYEKGAYVSNHVANWLRVNDHHDQCSAFLPYVKKLDESAIKGWVKYFEEAKCTGGASVVAKFLDNEGSAGQNERQLACR